MAKRKKARKRIQPVMAWATISEDDPPNIWYVAWWKDYLERQDLRQIQVMVVPLDEYRRLLKAAKASKP